MSDESAETTREHTRTQRRCLRCDTPFDSAWAGERICPHCKSSQAWRQGGVLSVQRPRSGS